MIVGNHELRGRVETLAMPFVVLQKNHVTEQLNLEKCKTHSNELNSVLNNETNYSTRPSYQVAAIINQKIIFSEYPNTIIR
jgi:hypothetical protein